MGKHLKRFFRQTYNELSKDMKADLKQFENVDINHDLSEREQLRLLKKTWNQMVIHAEEWRLKGEKELWGTDFIRPFQRDFKEAYLNAASLLETTIRTYHFEEHEYKQRHANLVSSISDRYIYIKRVI